MTIQRVGHPCFQTSKKIKKRNISNDITDSYSAQFHIECLINVYNQMGLLLCLHMLKHTVHWALELTWNYRNIEKTLSAGGAGPVLTVEASCWAPGPLIAQKKIEADTPNNTNCFFTFPIQTAGITSALYSTTVGRWEGDWLLCLIVNIHDR